jgi:hypothetical protein
MEKNHGQGNCKRNLKIEAKGNGGKQDKQSNRLLGSEKRSNSICNYKTCNN